MQMTKGQYEFMTNMKEIEGNTEPIRNMEVNTIGKYHSFIVTTDTKKMIVTITEGHQIAKVIQFLKNLQTGLQIEFYDYEQFSQTVGQVLSKIA